MQIPGYGLLWSRVLVNTGLFSTTRNFHASKQYLLPYHPTKKAPRHQLRKEHVVSDFQPGNENSELSAYLGKKLGSTRNLAPEQWETLKNNIIGFPFRHRE